MVDYVNLVTRNLNDSVAEIYECLMDGDDNGLIEEIDNQIQLLNDLRNSVENGSRL